MKLERSHAVEISFLVLATIYGLTLPFKESLTLFDAAVLVTLFVLYMFRVARAPAEEPHLVGPAQLIGALPVAQRRAALAALGLGAVIVILAVAEPFAESLVSVGEEFEINEFVLISIVAPLASEAPELLVAALFAWRLNTNAGLGTLVSSKVNQWTLLVGTLPIVFAIASASTHGLPIGAEQREELWVTAAQSAFAVAVLLNRSMSVTEAVTLFVLYIGNLISRIFPESIHDEARIGVGAIYIVLAVIVFIRHRRTVKPLLTDGFRRPYSELAEPEPVAPMNLDGRALVRGITVGLVVIVPVSVAVEALERNVDDLDGSPWLFIPFVAILGAYALAGRWAAMAAPDAPLVHAALAALGAFAGGWWCGCSCPLSKATISTSEPARWCSTRCSRWRSGCSAGRCGRVTPGHSARGENGGGGESAGRPRPDLLREDPSEERPGSTGQGAG